VIASVSSTSPAAFFFSTRSTAAPAVSRSCGFAREPSTRIWPERASFSIWMCDRCGQRRLNQRSSRMPSSASAT